MPDVSPVLMKMRRRNILHLIETSEPGGAETVLASIASNLDPDRYRSLACVLEEGWLTDQLRRLGIRYALIENRRSYDPAFLYRLVRLIRCERIALMHAHEFMMSVYGSVASIMTGVPLVCTVHGKLYFPDKKRRILALRFAASLCARMIAVSEDLHRYLVDNLRFNPCRVTTLYNGIDLEKYSARSSREESRMRFSIPADALVVSTAGSLFKVKGLQYLLEAVKVLRRRYPNLLLIIAGEGDQRKALEEKAEALGLADAVRFLGFCEDIPDLLNLTDIYACSSLSEGLSLSILEAMAMSKPVVATDVGGNLELIRPGDNGYLVPPSEPSALADRIMDLLDNPELRDRFGKSGRRIVEEKFTLEKMIQDYEELYERLTT